MTRDYVWNVKTVRPMLISEERVTKRTGGLILFREGGDVSES